MSSGGLRDRWHRATRMPSPASLQKVGSRTRGFGSTSRYPRVPGQVYLAALKASQPPSVRRWNHSTVNSSALGVMQKSTFSRTALAWLISG